MFDFTNAKPVKGHDGRYLVDTKGNVFSLLSNRELIQFTNAFGYRMVNLSINGKPKHCFVHRLVAEAFIENPNRHPVINHKDENKTNNDINNLEWCSYSYNICYGSANARRANALRGHIAPNRRGVYAKKGEADYWVYYPCITDAKDATGINTGRISEVCMGKRRSYRGSEFKYSDETGEKNG